MPLSAKHQRFVAEFLIDTNATQAAIRAGYSKKTARVQGSRLLTKAAVKQAVATGQARMVARLEQTADMKADELVAKVSAIARMKVRMGGKEVMRAIELLMKRYGLIKDRVSVENPDGTPLNLSGLSAEQIDQFEKLLALATTPPKV